VLLVLSVMANIVLIPFALPRAPETTAGEREAWVHGAAAIRSEAECWKRYTDLLKQQAGK
jgi:hypothetical protein